MAFEIERKFLVDHSKWKALAKPEGRYLRQGYLTDRKEATIRVRLDGDKAFITIKGATTGISRKEFEYEIPAEDGTELLNEFAPAAIEKVRFDIIFEGKLWEVDEFLGDNAGLIVAEIELTNENEHFVLPDWVSAEVSHDARYFNANLLKNPFRSWSR
ncbi:MAG TPA: CYTH domain-containing protein [Mucilaginibacter sp.]|nr:CYTH domain-containing protein [Mucilaginibacter sp.]